MALDAEKIPVRLSWRHFSATALSRSCLGWFRSPSQSPISWSKPHAKRRCRRLASRHAPSISALVPAAEKPGCNPLPGIAAFYHRCGRGPVQRQHVCLALSEHQARALRPETRLAIGQRFAKLATLA